VVGQLPLNFYDTAYALMWGRQILHGHLPSYQTPNASTPHPGSVALATLAAAFGTSGSYVVVQSVLFLALGAVGISLLAIGRACFSTAAAVVAVVILLINASFLTKGLAASGLSDMPAAALVVGALALEVRRPRRGTAPLLALALAGLLRPEAWALSGVYWLSLARRRTWHRLLVPAGLVLVGPFLWVLSDVIITGRATYSLSTTHAMLAPNPNYVSGLGNVPRVAIDDLHGLLGDHVSLAAALGIALAAVLAGRAAVTPLATVAAFLGAFAVLGAAQLPLLDRFLLVPAALLPLFFGFLLTAGEHPRLRQLPGWSVWRWAWAGAAAAVLALHLGQNLTKIADIRGNQREVIMAENGLVTLGKQSDTRRALADCPTIYIALRVPHFSGVIPISAYAFDVSPARFIYEGPSPRFGLQLVPAPAIGQLFRFKPQARSAYKQVARNSAWSLFARGC
jgi:hypothetical protein